jgi:anti-sigma factor RsiW
LSEYIDGALGAHETWELEKHLAACRECARALAELRRTVAAVQSAPRYEITPEFADALQLRLSRVTPKPARRAWLAGLPCLFRPRLIPAWGLGVAASVLAVIAFLPQRAPTGRPSGPPLVSSPSRELQAARAESVALAATNPFEDVASANLAASTPASEAASGE